MHVPRAYYELAFISAYGKRTLKNRNDLGLDKANADEYLSATANLIQ